MIRRGDHRPLAHRLVRGATTCAALAVVSSGSLAITVAAPASAVESETAATLFVSPTGHPDATDRSCGTAGYSTISDAVAGAAPGSTVYVCAGRYPEAVTIDNLVLHLVGQHATIAPPADASGAGLTVEGHGADGSTVRGFTITGAQQEGVLIQQVSDVVIERNQVTGNDLACQPQAGGNDCGEGLHLRAVTNSRVIDNLVNGNTGGIHITDGVPAGSIGSFAFGYTSAAGPSSGNLVEGNIVVDNLWDCGISLPSHNSNAMADPNAGGVYDNTVTRNVVVHNGTEGGGGSGVLVATPFPGTAAYNNTITHNAISDNGHAGVTIHSHAPGQNVSGNKIEHNRIGHNNTLTDGDSGDLQTTGIVVYSAVVPVTDTVITHNVIVDDHYGVWLDNAPGADTSHNTYVAVQVPLFTK